MRRLLLIASAAVSALSAQGVVGNAVNINPLSDTPWSFKTDYNSGTAAVYVGKAHAFDSKNRTVWTVGGSPALTSIVVATNVATATMVVAHGLEIGAEVTVQGSSHTGLDGKYRVATVPSSTTITFTVSAADATKTTSGMTIETLAPRTNALVWDLTYLINDGNGNATSVKNCGRNRAWDSRATYGCN